MTEARKFISKTARNSLVVICFVIIAIVFQRNTQAIINELDSLGSWAPLLFLLLYCLSSIFCLPTVLLVLTSGVVFGPIAGTLLSLLGATLGAVCGFCISRYVRPNAFHLEGNRRWMKWVKKVEHNGWKSVALLRLTPGIPYNLVNYGLGLTQIKFSHYLIATVIFLIPNKIIVTYFGYFGMNMFGFWV